LPKFAAKEDTLFFQHHFIKKAILYLNILYCWINLLIYYIRNKVNFKKLEYRFLIIFGQDFVIEIIITYCARIIKEPIEIIQGGLKNASPCHIA